MKQFLILLLLFNLSLKTSAQRPGPGYVVLHDDQKIRFGKIKELKDSLLVSFYGKKEGKIAISNVKGYYLQNEEEFYYIKPVPDSKYPEDYQFIKKDIRGKITLYKKIVETISNSTSSHNLSNATTYYYIEKSEQLENILTRSLLAGQQKKEELEILRSFVEDNPEISKTINEGFKLNYKNLTRILRTYNLAEYEQKETTDTLKNAEVILYRRDKKQTDGRIDVTLDNQVLYLKANSFVSIKIRPYELAKLCVGPENEICEIIEASPHFACFFELGFDSKSNIYSIEKKGKVEAEFYIKEMKYYAEKRDDK